MTTVSDRDLDALLAPDAREEKTQVPMSGRRRVLPNNEGTPVAHTHVTTIAQTVADSYGLNRWKLQRIVWAIGQRPDLALKLASVPVDDVGTINDVLRQAEVVAALEEGSNLGTSWHNILQRVDQGEDWRGGGTIPEYFHVGISNYLRALEYAGLTPLPQYIERTCRSSLYDDIEGTFDNIYRESDGSLVIGDKKTKDDITRITNYPHAITTQLALYASCDQIINYGTHQYEDMPPVRRDYAIIIFLDRETHEVQILKTDGLRGLWSIGVNMDAREWRKAKNLITEYTGPGGKSQGLVRPVSSFVSANGSVSVQMSTASERHPCKDCGTFIDYGYSRCQDCIDNTGTEERVQGNYAQIDELLRDATTQGPLDIDKVAQLNAQAAETVASTTSPETKPLGSGVLRVTDVTKEVVDKIIALGTQVAEETARANAWSVDNLPIGECPSADPPVDPAAEAGDMAGNNLRPVLQYRAHLLGVPAPELRRQRKGLAELIIARRNELRGQQSRPSSPLLSPPQQPPGQPVTDNGVLFDISQAQSRERLNEIWSNWVEKQNQKWTPELQSAAEAQLEKIRTGVSNTPPF